MKLPGCQSLLGYPESKEEWLSFIKKAGFRNITGSVGTMIYWEQIRGDLELQSMDFFWIWVRFFRLYFLKPEYKGSVHWLFKEALHIPRGFTSYFGYGTYVGQK